MENNESWKDKLPKEFRNLPVGEPWAWDFSEKHLAICARFGISALDIRDIMLRERIRRDTIRLKRYCDPNIKPEPHTHSLPSHSQAVGPKITEKRNPDLEPHPLPWYYKVKGILCKKYLTPKYDNPDENISPKESHRI